MLVVLGLMTIPGCDRSTRTDDEVTAQPATTNAAGTAASTAGGAKASAPPGQTSGSTEDEEHIVRDEGGDEWKGATNEPWQRPAGPGGDPGEEWLARAKKCKGPKGEDWREAYAKALRYYIHQSKRSARSRRHGGAPRRIDPDELGCRAARSPDGEAIPHLVQILDGRARSYVLVGPDGAVAHERGWAAARAYLRSIEFPEEPRNKWLVAVILQFFDAVPKTFDLDNFHDPRKPAYARPEEKAEPVVEMEREGEETVLYLYTADTYDEYRRVEGGALEYRDASVEGGGEQPPHFHRFRYEFGPKDAAQRSVEKKVWDSRGESSWVEVAKF
jgi:hypothetical protein